MSVAAIIVGVAAAQSGRSAIITAGIAGLVAGAASMAAGEYVSVSSQADAERADLRLERRELLDDRVGERAELAAIYLARGLSARLAEEVATELSTRDDVLAVHARDELGMTAPTVPDAALRAKRRFPARNGTESSRAVSAAW